MKAFDKISASRTPTEKSTLVDDLWFSKTEIFTKSDTKEVVDFVKEECPEILGGGIFYINSFPHLFDNSVLQSKRFVYILSCLRDEEGESIFNLKIQNELLTVQVTNVGVIETGDKQPKEEVIEKAETEVVIEEEKNIKAEVEAGTGEAEEIKTDDEEEKVDEVDEVVGIKAEEANTTEKTAENKVEISEIKDTLKAKFNLTELRAICKKFDGVKAKDVKKLKEDALVDIIFKNETIANIQKLFV